MNLRISFSLCVSCFLRGSLFEPTVAKKLAPIVAACQTKMVAQPGAHAERNVSTVEKALDILNLFSEDRPALGLSAASRLLNRDKATVLRHLNALESKGFVEQDTQSRAYSLGPAVVRLSAIRERTYPVSQGARNVLRHLVEATGETAHLSHFAGDSLAQVAVEETSTRGTRVFINMAEPLSFHGTASGLVYLSKLPPSRARALLAGPLVAHTPATPIAVDTIMARVEAAARAGTAESNGTFDADVYGIAAPVFAASGDVCGAVAVATPASRMNDEARHRIIPAVLKAAAEISHHYGARQPDREAAE
jgi:IclR family acetate operon transcriptional repressor